MSLVVKSLLTVILRLLFNANFSTGKYSATITASPCLIHCEINYFMSNLK